MLSGGGCRASATCPRAGIGNSRRPATSAPTSGFIVKQPSSPTRVGGRAAPAPAPSPPPTNRPTSPSTGGRRTRSRRWSRDAPSRSSCRGAGRHRPRTAASHRQPAPRRPALHRPGGSPSPGDSRPPGGEPSAESGSASGSAGPTDDARRGRYRTRPRVSLYTVRGGTEPDYGVAERGPRRRRRRAARDGLHHPAQPSAVSVVPPSAWPDWSAEESAGRGTSRTGR